jgi:hypothetical protein
VQPGPARGQLNLVTGVVMRLSCWP